MTTEHQPNYPSQHAGADDQSAPAAGAGPETPAAAEAAAAVSEPEPLDPLAGKLDEEIRALAAEGTEYLSLAQRTRADFDNYRKRTQRDIAAARTRGGVELARELLSAVDNLERAIEHENSVRNGAETADEGAEHLLAALRGTHAELVAALGRGGIVRFDPRGEPFDPKRHEAMAKRPVEGDEASGICAVTFQSGYAAGDEIVRPARVVVTD
jgi:molecular chaperone GrpE